MSESVQTNIIDTIKRSKKILVLPSSPPDGDSIGSAIALYMSLRKLDKEVTVVCSDPVPEVLEFLPNINIIGNTIRSSKDFIITLDCKNTIVDKIKSSIEDDKINIIITPEKGQFLEEDITFKKGKVSYDLIITVDTAEFSQLHSIYEKNTQMFNEIPVINIDHHVSNEHFGKINYVDIMASSTTELLFPLLEKLQKETKEQLIDEDVATLLLTGIITDTGSFQNANTTPKAFDTASELIAYGARQQEIIQYIFKTKQLSQLKLWGRVLSKIQTDEKHRIVWSTISQQDFRDTGSTYDQTGDVIDELMTNAPGAEIVVLIKEKDNNLISVSLRSTTSSVDVSKLAGGFGGGGHVQAAGLTIENADLVKAEFDILEAARKFQEPRIKVLESKKSPELEDNEDIINVEKLIEKNKKAQEEIEKEKQRKSSEK